MNKKVLVVEDDMIIGAILTLHLNQIGYSVKSVSNGKDALVALKEEHFSVIITDLEMPVMNGYEFIDRFNSLNYTSLIIVHSSHDEPEIISNVMNKGVLDYCIKPAKKNDIKEKLEYAFDILEQDQFKKHVGCEGHQSSKKQTDYRSSWLIHQNFSCRQPVQ
ncbi:response regulator [Spirochaetota bacterium]